MTDHEKNEILNAHDLSEKELESVAGGGVKIDWAATCVATVEDGSRCWSNDACWGKSVKYFRDRSKFGCSSTVAASGPLHWCRSSDACDIDETVYAFCDSNWRKD